MFNLFPLLVNTSQKLRPRLVYTQSQPLFVLITTWKKQDHPKAHRLYCIIKITRHQHKEAVYCHIDNHTAPNNHEHLVEQF